MKKESNRRLVAALYTKKEGEFRFFAITAREKACILKSSKPVPEGRFKLLDYEFSFVKNGVQDIFKQLFIGYNKFPPVTPESVRRSRNK